MQLIAFITERSVIVRILDQLGELGRAPWMAASRGPPRRETEFWIYYPSSAPPRGEVADGIDFFHQDPP